MTATLPTTDCHMEMEVVKSKVGFVDFPACAAAAINRGPWKSVTKAMLPCDCCVKRKGH